MQVSTKLNRSHLIHGKEALILPCLGRSDKDIINGEEQFVSCENSMGVVQSSQGVLDPISDKLLSEPVIVCKLADATLGKKSKIDWLRYSQNYDVIRADIERTIPGFEDYNERVREPGGFYLPNCNRDGEFDTASQKAHFNIADPIEHTLQKDELIMMTIRSHDQFNTTIYGLNDRYRGIHNERRIILISATDAARHGLYNNDLVDLYNYDDGIERVAHKFVVVIYSIPEGCCATYFPEANVFASVSNVVKKSNMPASKYVKIKIEKQNSERYKKVDEMLIARHFSCFDFSLLSLPLQFWLQ